VRVFGYIVLALDEHAEYMTYFRDVSRGYHAGDGVEVFLG
jgi:hypothetical protein